nr:MULTISPECIES: hypothetical protein [Pseudomonas]
MRLLRSRARASSLTTKAISRCRLLLLLAQQSFHESALFPLSNPPYLCRTKQHLPSKKVLKMSNTMGIASAFVLSSLFLSPFAVAEESPAFVAHNAARAASYEEHQGEMTAKAKEAAQTPQASMSSSQPRVEKDS